MSNSELSDLSLEVRLCSDGKYRRRLIISGPDALSDYPLKESSGGFVRIAVDIEQRPRIGWVMTETFEKEIPKNNSWIKPCPFCGSENLDTLAFAASQGYVECRNCGATGPMDPRAADPECDTAAAVDAWNNRVE